MCVIFRYFSLGPNVFLSTLFPSFLITVLTVEWSQILHVRKTTANIILLFVRVMTHPYERDIKVDYFELNASVHNQKWLPRSSCVLNLLFPFIWRYSITVRRHTERYVQIRVFILSVFCIKKILFLKYSHLHKTYCHAECTDPIYHTRIVRVIQDHIMLGCYAWYTDSMHNT